MLTSCRMTNLFDFPRLIIVYTHVPPFEGHPIQSASHARDVYYESANIVCCVIHYKHIHRFIYSCGN